MYCVLCCRHLCYYENKYSTALFQVLYLLQVIWALEYQPEVFQKWEFHPGLLSTTKKSWEDPHYHICLALEVQDQTSTIHFFGHMFFFFLHFWSYGHFLVK